MKRTACILLAAIPSAAFAQVTSAGLGLGEPVRSQQIASILAHPLAQVKVANCADAARDLLWNKSTRLSYTADGLALSGTDALGNTWSTVIPASNVLNCEIWSAVLSKGAKQSLIVFKAPETGGVYGGELTVLSFDATGRPFPWQSEGGFTSTKYGITQITTDASTGDSQILVPTREGDAHDGFGYVTYLFRADKQGFTKVLGREASGATWPVVEGNQNALSGNESKPTDSIAIAGFQASVAEAALTTSKVIKISKVLGFDQEEPITYTDGTRSRYPVILVWIKPDQSTRIYFDEHTVEGVEDILKVNASVTLEGISCESDECRPYLILAH